jgi:hypothetical protein
MPPKKKEQEIKNKKNKEILNKKKRNKEIFKKNIQKNISEFEEELGVEEFDEEEVEEEEEEVVEEPKEVKKEITEQELRSVKNIKTLRTMLNTLARSKVPIKGGLSDEQIKTQQKKVTDKLIKKDAAKYLKYIIRDSAALNALKRDDLIQKILDLADEPNLTDEEIESGKYKYKRPKNAADSDKSINKIKNELSDKQATDAEKLKKVYAEFDKLIEMDKADSSEETKARIKESGELVKQLLGNIYESKSLTKEEFNQLYGDIVVIVNERMAKVDLSKVVVDKPVIMNDAKAFNAAVQKNIKTQEDMKELMKQANEARLTRQGKSPQVKDPASGMEVKMAPSEVKKAPYKLGSRENPIIIGPEEKKEEPFIPKPVVGTDYQGSKEMFVKPEQKPLEPFGGLQSQNEVEAPYLSTKSDKAIGDVRQVGFIGAQDQLAKVEDVTLEPSERSKSLKRFTNFRWVQSVQNSDLGYASPFQRMDDIDDRRRFGKCFMHGNKMPKDADTQDELDKAKGFNTYSLVPSFDMSSRMQPATPLSFINSTSKFARKLTKDEMEPINQGKRNVNNVKNHLEFPSLLFNDDPLMRIKDKYKNNIVC